MINEFISNVKENLGIYKHLASKEKDNFYKMRGRLNSFASDELDNESSFLSKDSSVYNTTYYLYKEDSKGNFHIKSEHTIEGDYNNYLVVDVDNIVNFDKDIDKLKFHLNFRELKYNQEENNLYYKDNYHIDFDYSGDDLGDFIITDCDSNKKYAISTISVRNNRSRVK